MPWAFPKVRHFNGRQRGIPTFVASFGSRAFQRLFQILRGQDSKGHRSLPLQGNLAHTLRDKRNHLFEMRSPAANHATQSD